MSEWRLNSAAAQVVGMTGTGSQDGVYAFLVSVCPLCYLLFIRPRKGGVPQRSSEKENLWLANCVRRWIELVFAGDIMNLESFFH